MKTPFPRIKVSRKELRLMFNSGCFQDRLRSGELRDILEAESHPTPPKSTQPVCTYSQILAYLDSKNQKVAIVHQFKRQNGSIGGSGLPDPKLLLIKGVVYYV
jgi:hypothetical protein